MAVSGDETAPRLTEMGDRIHDLKTWPMWFRDVATRRKEFEVRRDDRDFQPGDWLLLHEWDPTVMAPGADAPGRYTGRKLIRHVRYVLRGREAEGFGVQAGFCVLGLSHSEADL